MKALHATNILMDDRKLQDFIAYMQQYSKNVLFIDTEAPLVDLKKSWEYFFKNDILFLIANVATKNTDEIKEDYDSLNANFEKEKTAGNFLKLLAFVFSRFQKIDDWYNRLDRLSSSEHSLKVDFAVYIQSFLKKEMENIREMLLYLYHQEERRKNAESLRNDLLKFNPIWGDVDKEDSYLREKIFGGNDEEEKLISASIVLNKTFDIVFHATEAIIKKGKNYFDEAIHPNENHSHDHHPHVALIIAFLKLFEYVNEDLNKIPQKLLDFYYRDVLRIREKDAVSDRTFVVFELLKGYHAYEIKKGTKLSAGKDNQNKELIYETEKDIVINKAQVGSLSTIYIDRNENDEILNYYKGTIDQNAAQALAASDKMLELPTIFGKPLPGAITEIGFAIASSQFYLAKGDRHVLIVFETADAIASCNPSQDNKKIELFDTSLVRLLLTGEKGWINSDAADSGISIESIKKTGETRIELSLAISIKQEQAIIAFDKKLHAGNFNTDFPLLQCILKYPEFPKTEDDQTYAKWQDQVDQLCVLQKLEVVGISVRVQVGNIQSKISFDGVRDLVLENDESVLDSKKPFYPFTTVPKVGSSFYIGCGDLYYKRTQNVAVSIEWILPDNFRSYYQKYLPPYDSNKFIASLSLLADKRWKKISDISVIDTSASDPKLTAIKINNIDKIKQSIQSQDDIYAFDNIKKNGTLRLKLGYPDFGHGVYPQLITSAVMEKATEKSGVNFYKLVKRELHDSVISIKLPPDLNQKTGSLKVIYDILEKVDDNTRAKTMIINALSDIIRKYNGDNVITRRPGQANEPPVVDDNEGRRIVNDQNFGEWALRMLKKIKLVNKNVHADRDRQDADDVVDEIKEDINARADFIMPSDKELVNLIMNETKTAINKTVINVVDEILALKAQGMPEPRDIARLLEKEFGEANGVINDMIAKRIAILISTNEIPPPPYMPLISSISLSYSAEKELSLLEGDKLFYISPLGIAETDLFSAGQQSDSGATVKKYIFPKQLIGYSERDWQGILFIGIKDLLPNQNLSLLIQVAEGTKMNDKKPPPVSWFCFSDGEWIELKDDNIISDSSYGLQTTGIIEFSIPENASNTNSLFNTESLYWLCAGIEQDADAFPLLINVQSQAVTVIFKDYKNNPAHLALPLEAGKIKTIVDGLPQVKKVSQPVASFNGKVGESEQEYYIRVSERLRHKSRAITNWDYESLVLEKFPSFYKVKCLNNYYNGHFAIGHVTVVPIADLRNKIYSGSSMLIPRASYLDLRDIESFLRLKSSPFVKIHAVNPQLEHVLIKCRVKFCDGVDKGFHLQKLNEDLIQFLSPWATGGPDALSFSSKMYSSSIINFIDKQEYVDYVVDLEMQQYVETDQGEKIFVTDPHEFFSLVETELTTQHSILVSAPEHEIELVK